MKNIHKINKNIYITSDEEIKEGDWCIDIEDSTVFKVKEQGHSGLLRSTTDSFVEDSSKKIILTTDPDLIKDGVQAIPDEFLEWFVKNPSCEEVGVESNYRVKSGTIKEHNEGKAGYEYYEYKIIIPKEEHILEEAKQRAKNYMSLKGALDSQYVDFSNPNADKITSASTTTIKEEPKQETLEEAAKRIYGSDASKDVEFYAFILGAKWQQERMYSLEEMRLAIKKARDMSDGKDCFDAEDISGCTEVCTYGWKFNMSEDLIIEQFKKK